MLEIDVKENPNKNPLNLSDEDEMKMEHYAYYLANVKHWCRDNDINPLNPSFSKIREIVYEEIFESDEIAKNFFSEGYKMYLLS